MAKDQAVQDFLLAVQQGEQQVLTDKGGELYDKAFAEGVASVPAGQGGISPEQEQADIAAAVAQVQADMQLKIDDLGKQLADALAAKQADEQVIQGLQASVSAMQGFLDQLKAIVLPVPAPQPQA